MSDLNSLQIFVVEQTALENAKEIVNTTTISHEELRSAFSNFIDEYAALLIKTTKMTRISDSTQSKLRKIQLKLEEQNEKINIQNEELTTVNATKDKFFSIISHDLRNPVTSIMLMSDIIAQNLGHYSQDQLEQNITKISSSIKTLYELFENLHRWSKSQTGTIEFKQETFELNDVIQRVFDLVGTHAENKGISLINKIEQPIHIKADKNMIETVIRNLVSNAIKFTRSSGSIFLDCKMLDDNKVQIIVEDNGIGMSHEVKSRLFKIGENIKSKGTAKEVGSGLGLILCKEFVDRHNGNIDVESEIDAGSKFIISIPQIES